MFDQNFFIAEIGNNHQGDIEIAKKMILAAKNSGASAVKFQKRNNKALMQKILCDKDYDNRNSFGKTYLEHREKVELNIQEFKELKSFSEDNGIFFFATPFDLPSLEELESIDCDLYKIASADIVHSELLKAVCETGKPVIISTGGSTINEIDSAVELVRSYGNELSILQCTASYPCEPKDMNLGVISTFIKRYPDATIGLSDHQSGISMALVAYTLGARVFEKHFTLHRSWKGTDQSFSLEPNGLRRMIRDINEIKEAIGDGKKVPLEIEKDAMFKMRKSIVSKVDIPKGTLITREMLDTKVPWNGITVDKMHLILGKKTVKNILCDSPIMLDDLI